MKNKDYILNPLFLLSLALLLLNDFFLKDLFHNEITGKLSDLSGITVFAFFFTAILGDRFKSWVFVISTLLFCWWKSAWSDPFIYSWSHSFYPIARVKDPSDLICLLILVPAWVYRPDKIRFSNHWVLTPVLLLTVFAVAATSKTKNLQAYGTATRFEIQESFKLKMTHAEFLKDLSFINITIEKNPDAVPPSKPGDPYSYILKNFTMSDKLVVESMFISIKEKKKGIKLTIHEAYLSEYPESTRKEIREMVIDQCADFFPLQD